MSDDSVGNEAHRLHRQAVGDVPQPAHLETEAIGVHHAQGRVVWKELLERVGNVGGGADEVDVAPAGGSFFGDRDQRVGIREERIVDQAQRRDESLRGGVERDRPRAPVVAGDDRVELLSVELDQIERGLHGCRGGVPGDRPGLVDRAHHQADITPERLLDLQPSDGVGLDDLETGGRVLVARHVVGEVVWRAVVEHQRDVAAERELEAPAGGI